jgi:ABC-type glutathione transport system ATPase component
MSADMLAEIEGLRVSIRSGGSDVEILHGVDLSVRRGEILGVIGESGSGKTMTGLALLRLLPANADAKAKRMRFDSMDLPLLDNRAFDDLRGLRMAMIFQDPVGSFNPAKTIGWHFRRVFRRAGQSENANGGWKVRAIGLMKDVGVLRAAESIECFPHQLSGGMLQRALIALVLGLQPDLVVADEPTTNLDKLVEHQILQLFKDMRSRLSAGMIFVTHDMAAAASLCDRIAVMKAGRVVETGTSRQIFENPQHDYTRLLIRTAFELSYGRNGRSVPPTGSSATERPDVRPIEPKPQPRSDTPLLKINGLDLVYPMHGGKRPFQALKKISLDLRQGEILGLVGESGSGKTTLGKTIVRLYEPTGGTLLFGGKDITHLHERQLQPYRRRMQMVFQDPAGSFNPRKTIGAALSTPLLTHGICTKAELSGRITMLLDRVELTAAHAERFPHELSGGQLQRAAIARAISLAPALIVADEAVSKLDVSIRAGVLDLFRSIQAETNLSMIFITHDLEVARFLCHRVALLYRGSLIEIGDTADIFANPQHDYTKALLSTLEHSLSGTAPAAPPAVRELAS